MASLHTDPPKEIFQLQDAEFIQQYIEARDYTSYLYVYNIFNEDEMESVDAVTEFRERNKLFLKVLSGKGKGGYKIFKKVLAKRGYIDQFVKYNVDGVRDVTLKSDRTAVERALRENIDSKDEQQIMQNMYQLVRKMEATRLTSYLATKQVIDGHDMATIDSLPQPLRNNELLRIVCARGNSSFMWFVEGLRVKGYGRLCNMLLGRPVTSSTNLLENSDDGDDDDSGDQAEDIDDNDSISNPPSLKNESNKNTDTGSYNKEHIVDWPGSEVNKTKAIVSQETSNEAHPVYSIGKSQKEGEHHQILNKPIVDDIVQANKKTSSEAQNCSNSDNKTDTGSNTGDDKCEQNDLRETITQETREVEAQEKDDDDALEVEDFNRADIEEDTVSNKESRQGDGNLQIHNKKTQVSNESNVTIADEDVNKTPRSPYQKVIHRNITRDPIDCDLREKLKMNSYVLENCLNANEVASSMDGKGILDRVDVDTIRSLGEENQRVRELISLVTWGGPTAYTVFLEALDHACQREAFNILKPDISNEAQTNNEELLKIPNIVIDEIANVPDADSD